MKRVYLLILLLLLGTLSNCVSAGPGYTISPAFIMTDLTLNKDISTSTEVGAKAGEACVYNILYIASFGDASIKKAQEDAGIKIVKAVDYQYVSILGYIYTSVCTIARGD